MTPLGTSEGGNCAEKRGRFNHDAPEAWNLVQVPALVLVLLLLVLVPALLLLSILLLTLQLRLNLARELRPSLQMSDLRAAVVQVQLSM